MKVYMSNFRPTRGLLNLFIRIYMEWFSSGHQENNYNGNSYKNILDTIIRSMLYTDNIISAYLITDGK